MQLVGPLFQEWKEILNSKDIEPLQYFPTYSYLVKLNDEKFNESKNLPIIVHIREYGYYDKGVFLSDQTRRDISDLNVSNINAAHFQRLIILDILIHPKEDVNQVASWLMQNQAEIFYQREQTIRIIGQLPLILRALNLPEIQMIEEYIAPKPFSDKLRSVLSTEDDELRKHIESIQLKGRNQIVGVADVAIDITHPAFNGRIVGVDYRCGISANLDSENHGTHVSGIILGSYCGIAPDAKLYFQSLRKSDADPFGGLPAPLTDLFESAYMNNVRIHNNSWGSPSPKLTYSLNAMSVDSFVHQNPDILIVAAAGNDGKSTSSSEKFNLSSLGDLATAKNALAVGASKTEDRCSFLWPKSSIGPCLDNANRIKPDILAPGVDILGPRSHDSVDPSVPLLSYDGNDYARFSGTSQAAAVVSGCAAIVRQYYSDCKGHKPSAALLKGTILNGTVFLTPPDPNSALERNDLGILDSDESSIVSTPKCHIFTIHVLNEGIAATIEL